jgi:single-stranded DNA-binding protein
MTHGIDCAFVGQLTHHPELKKSAAQKSWCRVSLAVGGDRVSVGLFGENAEYVCSTLRKGDPLYVQGVLSLAEWIGKDGKPRSGLSVVASRAEGAGDRQAQTQAHTGAKSSGGDERC